jgi:Zn-dependent peptidase ImmA (M78 family)
MSDPVVRRTAEAFWRAAGDARRLPRDVESAAVWAVPMGILKIPNLWLSDAESSLLRRRLPIVPDIEDRPLHGCVYAFKGRGLLIINGTAEPSEVRFTIAHELGHYLFDYLMPRERAVAKFGAQITGVLDGLRPADVNERVDALLGNVPIGVYRHLMDRDHDACATSESRADLLAIELLAPEHELRRQLPREARHSGSDLSGTIHRLLTGIFGLPSSVARSHAVRLSHEWFRPRSVREWLGILR